MFGFRFINPEEFHERVKNLCKDLTGEPKNKWDAFKRGTYFDVFDVEYSERPLNTTIELTVNIQNLAGDYSNMAPPVESFRKLFEIDLA